MSHVDNGALGARLHEAHQMVDQYVLEHPKLAATMLVDTSAKYRIEMLRGLLGLTAQAMHQLGVADDVARQVLRYVLDGGAPTHQEALARQRELAQREHTVSTAPVRLHPPDAVPPGGPVCRACVLGGCPTHPGDTYRYRDGGP